MAERLDILINARNNTSPAFREVTGDVRALQADIAAAGKGLNLTEVFTGFSAAVQGIQQVRAAVSELNETTREGAVSLQLKDVLGSYAESAGTSAQKIVSAAKVASMGTIAEFDLILQANRSLQFEVAKTPEQFKKLIGLGTALGRAQGISDTQALEYLTSGIARESKLILDNLGLIIDIDQATEDYATTIGTTADKLTSYERKQAILAEAFRQGETAIKANEAAAASAATQFEKLDANVKDLRISLGELSALAAADTVGAVANIAGKAATLISEGQTVELIRQQLAEARTLRDEFAKLGPQRTVFGISEEAISQQRSQLGEYNRVVRELEAQLLALSGGARIAVDEVNAVGDGFISGSDKALTFGLSAYAAALEAEHLGVASLDGAEGLSTLESMAWSTATSLDAVADASLRAASVGNRLQGVRNQAIAQAESQALRAIQAGADPAATIAQFGALADQIQNTALNTEATNEAMLENKLRVQELAPEYRAVWEEAVRIDQESKRAAKDGISAMSDAAREAKRQFEELTGVVSSVLGDALRVDVGVNPDDILPRSDAINENARRIADIAVNGFSSPWYAYFQSEFPALFQEMFAGAAGDSGVKLQAAQILKDFEDGLNPELIDKERAKARVRRILLGEANMSQLATEIAQELSAEFGNSLSLGQIQDVTNEALGVGGASATAGIAASVSNSLGIQLSTVGATVKTSIVSALDGVGELIALTTDKQLKAESNLKILEAAGYSSGQTWSAGFMRSVQELPAKTLAVLADLLAPYQEASAAKAASLTGAN